MGAKKITVKVEGGTDAVLDLTAQEVETVKGILSRSGLKTVFCLKDKGAAMFFTNENAAANNQDRLKIDNLFYLDAEVLADTKNESK